MRPSQRPVADPEAADPVSVLVLFGAPELAGLTSTSLEREGIRVTVAETPEEAVDCVETGDVDCVVTDVVDPGVDDGSLLRQLRALRPGLPYVLFTSHLPPGLAVEALRLGATDYVERAAGTEQYARLAARVREAVARYRSDRRLAQFDRALDEVTEGLAMVDDEGVLVHANEAFQSRFGLESGVVSGTPLVEALTPAAAETLETELRPTLEEAGRWVGYLGGDGDLLCSATALPDGGYALVVTPLEDDRVEREFEALQRRYRSVFTQGFDAMLIADDEGRYVEANPAARRLLGLPTERILGRRIDEFAEEEYDFEAAWETFLEEGRMAGEFTLVRPDGERRVLEFEARADVVPGEHLSVLRDVTERIEHEAELERAYQRYHTVVESLPELAVVLVDDAGRYLVVDGGGVPALGLEGEVPPRTPVRSVHAPAVADTLGALYDRICGGEPLHTELEVGERTLSLVGRPVEGPEGGTSGRRRLPRRDRAPRPGGSHPRAERATRGVRERREPRPADTAGRRERVGRTRPWR